jgi:BirA family transcriptional regulator, biotin operon repressor / biotin---[acetyl-CoA-carboxylase] ligase
MTKSGFSEFRLIRLDEVDSTNNYATSLLASEKVEEGTVVLTFRQTHGRGYSKNVWESEDFKNLTFSLILLPRFLPASDQFLISQAVSLGLADFFLSETGGVSIKWPNDLLIHDKKVAGILIENMVSGLNLYTSVIGIGINLNQTIFPGHLPHATSLSIVTGRQYPLTETLNLIIGEIMKWYNFLKDNRADTVQKMYLNHLFRIGEKTEFRRDNQVFEAQITGIDEYGQLLLKDSSGKTEAYPFKSVEMIY